MIILYDNRTKAQQLAGKLALQGCTLREYGTDGLPGDGLQEEEICLLLKNDSLKAATQRLFSAGIYEIRVCPWDIQTELTPVQIDNTKPRLEYLEFEICNFCNLNCKGCCNFCNLCEKPTFADMETFWRDFKRLRQLFWGIGKIRIMGGEPLLNKQVADFALLSREFFPDADIRIVSNGLLIDSLSTDSLKKIKQAGCSFDISLYPPTLKKLASIKRTLESAGIRYHIGPLMLFFFRTLTAEPHTDADAARKNCLFSYCHMLENGYISSCSFQMCAHRLNEKFGTELPADDKLDLYDDGISGWELEKEFASTHEFCARCTRAVVPYLWQGNYKKDARATDWLVGKNAINDKVLPAFQKCWAGILWRMRKYVQRPKKNK